jgi:carbonic anhydrase
MRQLASLAVALTAVSIVTVGGATGPAAGVESLSRLKAGNARFAASPEEAVAATAAERAALANGQHPFATVLSCADSRVPPEIIFRARLGDLFVVRAAGNITDRAVLASVEYAAEHLHVPLIVVMGHEFCGAVKAASETPASRSLGPNLDYLLKAIRPSVAAAKAQPEAERLRAAILENVEETLNDMLVESEILRAAGRTGEVTFVGAYYEMTSGRVQFSEPLQIPGMTTAPTPVAQADRHSGGRR